MQLKVIEGGLKSPALTTKKVLRAAQVSNTRLMGVIYVHAIWDLYESDFKELHQFFYFDAEEFGFDTYESVLSKGQHDQDAHEKIERITNRMSGGLGCEMRTLHENELRYLVQCYAKFNEEIGDVLPGNAEEYEFLMNPKIDFSADDLNCFLDRATVTITTPYEAINYFIMRNVGHDFIASRYLTCAPLELNLFPEHKAASLLRNVVKELIGETGVNTSYKSTDEHGSFKTLKRYMNESLIEYDDRFFILTSEVALDGFKIAEYKRLNSFEITAIEADFMTEREEHISLYRLAVDPDVFDEDATEFTRRALLTEHGNGKIFLIFYPNNDHVKKSTFRLSDDVLGAYYISDSGELVTVCYDKLSAMLLQNDLLASCFNDFLEPVANYCFGKPIFYDYVDSGFGDFLEFVEAVSEPES